MKYCVLRTLVDLRRSIRRNRTISLPTLLRLFKRRWAEIKPTPKHKELEQAGLDALWQHYQHQSRT